MAGLKEEDWGTGALVAGVFYLVARAFGKEKPPVEGLDASISIQLIDAATGLPVPKNSPALVVESASYIARVTVTNRSTKTGAPTAATLTISIAGFAGAKTIPFPAAWSNAFLAGETKAWEITFIVPADTAGTIARITVSVNDPGGTSVAAVVEPLTISAAAIVFAAGVTITVA